MAVELKRLSPEDFELAKLVSLFFQVDDGVENPTSVSDEYMKKLLSKKGFHILVAVENDEILGGLTAYEFVKYKSEETEMFLYEIGVEERHRRKGVAGKLLEGLRKICAEKNISTIFVATEIGNEAARKFYEKTGGKFENAALYTYEI